MKCPNRVLETVVALIKSQDLGNPPPSIESVKFLLEWAGAGLAKRKAAKASVAEEN